MPAKTQIISDDTNPVTEHSSVKMVQMSPQEGSSVSLQECFRYRVILCGLENYFILKYFYKKYFK